MILVQASWSERERDAKHRRWASPQPWSGAGRHRPSTGAPHGHPRAASSSLIVAFRSICPSALPEEAATSNRGFSGSSHGAGSRTGLHRALGRQVAHPARELLQARRTTGHDARGRDQTFAWGRAARRSANSIRPMPPQSGAPLIPRSRPCGRPPSARSGPTKRAADRATGETAMPSRTVRTFAAGALIEGVPHPPRILRRCVTTDARLADQSRRRSPA